jgi:5-methyltetrahydropteroyltriglutamate--homocysteine methyltransferase
MKRSVDRILTTHTGSLIRPPKLLEFVKARQAGQAIDQSAYEATLKDSVRDVVARQVEAGIDIPNDGEFGKSTSWSLYVLKRLSGFELREVKGANPFARGADRLRFADFYAELEGRGDGKDWSNVTRKDAICVGPITYDGLFELQRDIDNLKAAAIAAGVDEAFLPVAAPSSAIPDRKNEYYKTDEDLVVALAEALRTEYRSIVDAGFLLQVDDARASASTAAIRPMVRRVSSASRRLRSVAIRPPSRPARPGRRGSRARIAGQWGRAG